MQTGSHYTHAACLGTQISCLPPQTTYFAQSQTDLLFIITPDRLNTIHTLQKSNIKASRVHLPKK